jgi:pectate lyase
MKLVLKNRIQVWILALLFVSLFAQAQTPAFPGAEGHGRYTSGGRGGTVYYVTSLEDNNNPGSLRYAVTRSGARTVLFAVSGTIWLNSSLSIRNGNLTIAGQSAPGNGVCLAGYPVSVDADQVIIRYLRFRMGDLRDLNADGTDALGGRRHKNIMIDHCSVSWSTDECCSFYENSNFTLQWCLISESLNFSQHSKGAHGYGGIWGGHGASFHHNLMAHHKSRVPRLGPGATSTPSNELCDIRNNLYYNYAGEGCYGGEALHANVVNNYYDPGPAGQSLNSTKKGRILAIDKKIDNSYPAIDQVWGTFFIDDNIVLGHANASADNWTYGVFNQIHSKYGTLTQDEKDALRLSEPLPTNVITTHGAEQAREKVLDYAGCSLIRDALDARIVEEARSRTATFSGAQSALPGIIDSQQDLRPTDAPDNWSAWPDLASDAPPVTDTDGDGIPDGWLERHYPGKTANDRNDEGYTFLEVYLNGLVSEITEEQNRGGSISSLKTTGGSQSTITHFIDPHTKTLTVRAEKAIQRIDLFSATGQRVYSSPVSSDKEKTVNLSKIPVGIYLARISLQSARQPVVLKIKR